MVLHRLLNYKPKGFYVDIGAHHPYRFSNTFKFYLKGWRGINVDPLPGSMELFRRQRPHDVNLEIAIGPTDGEELTYYMFNEPTLNTFDPVMAQQARSAQYVLKRCVSVKTVTLRSVLEQYLKPNQSIDFLSVDVEGFDLEVLQSNDWEKFNPAFVVAESCYTTLEQNATSPLTLLLGGHGYGIVSKTANSLIYGKTACRPA